MPENQNGNKKVDFQIFMWAIGIIFVAISGLTGFQAMLSQKVDRSVEANNAVRRDVDVIKNDTGWIRKSLERLENNAKQQSTIQSGASETSPR